MMIRCLDADSWLNAALGRSEFVALAHWVPKGFRFGVYVGKRGCPDLMDCQTKFVCLGCKRIGRGKWLAKVRVAKNG